MGIKFGKMSENNQVQTKQMLKGQRLANQNFKAISGEKIQRSIMKKDIAA